MLTFIIDRIYKINIAENNDLSKLLSVFISYYPQFISIIPRKIKLQLKDPDFNFYIMKHLPKICQQSCPIHDYN